MKHVQKALAVVLATFALAAAAHHGWSGYDTKPIKFNGTIEQSAYENPHGTARVKTAEKTWRVVLAPVSRMETRRFGSNSAGGRSGCTRIPVRTA